MTVTDPLPGVNTLKSLDVDPGSISPAFSADHTSYAMSVAEGVGKVTVSATPSDSAAKVSVSGNTDLKDGENKISIVVTAQNGSKKTYTIIATRAGPSPTPMPSPTPEATPTPAVTIDVGGAGFAIIEAPADKPVPEGFYGSLAEINGQMVPAYKSLKGDLTLFYLSNQTAADGFYYYDKEASKYLPYTVLSLPAQTFSVLKPDAATVIPAGWQETTLKINNQDLPAWQQADTDGQSAAGDVYLLYLMNSQGNKDFYLYDTESQLLSFYAMTSFTTGTEETTTSSEEPTLSPTPAAADTTADTTKPNFWTLATAVLGLLCLVLTGLLIWQNVKANRRDDDNPDDDDFEPPEPPPIRRVD
ncbi:MAG: cadherin-like beta sandwich domain-containing protein [Clostridiaceae bacterium]|nr:cadherin-like beta sandwich domain-containing protein [Clostridiaceae bacterium]